jgi:hypothetical protein
MRQAPSGVTLVPQDQPDPEEALTEDEEILYGGEAQEVDPAAIMQSVNARVQGSTIPVPTRTLRMLPALRRAAQDPSLPVSVRDMYRTTVLAIEARLKNGR